MIITSKDGRRMEFGQFESAHTELLLAYLTGLNEETRGRFEPHPFTLEGINQIFNSVAGVKGYIAFDVLSRQIIAYSLIRAGFIETDIPRYESYGIIPGEETVCTYAPSVADHWQGSGIGSQMLGIILEDAGKNNFRMMVLWGGVQATNKPALNFYQKHGFRIVGEFEHHGMNYDMVLSLV